MDESAYLVYILSEINKILKRVMAGVTFVVLCLLLSLSAVAQTPDSLAQKKPILPDLKQDMVAKGRRPSTLVQREIVTDKAELRSEADTLSSRKAESDTVHVSDSLLRETDSAAALLHAKMLKEFQDSIRKDSLMRADFGEVRLFNPDPTRALWMSLLFPGLGQVYNRRYWKLPIVVGGFVGLVYATSWNNRMYQDYTKGYRDAMDSDPNTKSYMDFYPPTTKEENINMDWLKTALKNKKDYFRRNKELCVICTVGLYLLCAVDAYVDASLMQFDVSDDLSMRVKPAVVEPGYLGSKLPAMGVQCAVTF